MKRKGIVPILAVLMIALISSPVTTQGLTPVAVAVGNTFQFEVRDVSATSKVNGTEYIDQSDLDELPLGEVFDVEVTSIEEAESGFLSDADTQVNITETFQGETRDTYSLVDGWYDFLFIGFLIGLLGGAAEPSPGDFGEPEEDDLGVDVGFEDDDSSTLPYFVTNNESFYDEITTPSDDFNVADFSFTLSPGDNLTRIFVESDVDKSNKVFTANFAAEARGSGSIDGESVSSHALFEMGIKADYGRSVVECFGLRILFETSYGSASAEADVVIFLAEVGANCDGIAEFAGSDDDDGILSSIPLPGAAFFAIILSSLALLVRKSKKY